MFDWLRQLFFRDSAVAGDRGGEGERLAAAFLQRERGFSIVVRNWRNPRDRRAEIDLVGNDGGVLVFVEVKTRTAGALVPGYYAVDHRKKRALRRACEAYLGQLGTKPRSFRFDVVEVALPAADATAETAPEVRHFENIPLFGKNYRG